MADFSPDAPEFYQRTHRVRLKNSGTSDKKSSHKIKYKKIPRVHNNAVGEPNIIIAREVLYCKLKQLQPPAQQVVYLFSKVPFFGSTKNFIM